MIDAALPAAAQPDILPTAATVPSSGRGDGDTADNPGDVAHAMALVRQADVARFSAYLHLYWHLHVVGTPTETARAKQRDLKAFARFFADAVQTDLLDDWTPAVTRAFFTELRTAPSPKTGQPLGEASLARVFATVRHFARWLCDERPPVAGNPLRGVRPPTPPTPSFRALTARQLMRLKSALEKRLALHTAGELRKDQEPRLEAAVYFTLLRTGLREHELVRLDLEQYHHRGFHNVRRKGAKVTPKVPVPGEAREALDRYIAEVRGTAPGPLFASRRAERLTARGVAYICERLSDEASAHLPESERFHLTPHMLRHTFLKSIAESRGIQAAQEMSGNISVRDIFRYTKPSADEMEMFAEEAF